MIGTTKHFTGPKFSLVKTWAFRSIRMGGCSSSLESEGEDWEIPRGQEYRHSRCTVRAPHQLRIVAKGEICDYCRIVRKVSRKTRYRCDACKLNFCFNRRRNDFRNWHSPRFDHLRMSRKFSPAASLHQVSSRTQFKLCYLRGESLVLACIRCSVTGYQSPSWESGFGLASTPCT